MAQLRFWDSSFLSVAHHGTPHLYLASRLSNTLGSGMHSLYSGVFLGVMGCCHNNCLLDLTLVPLEVFHWLFRHFFFVF